MGWKKRTVAVFSCTLLAALTACGTTQTTDDTAEEKPASFEFVEVSKEDLPEGCVTFDNHAYLFVEDKTITDFDKAMDWCSSKNGYLATITSEEENDFLASYLKDNSFDAAFFALQAFEGDETWSYYTGEDAAYVNWEKDGEPSSKDNLNALLFPAGKWNTGAFGSEADGYAFLCEWTLKQQEETESAPTVEETLKELFPDSKFPLELGFSSGAGGWFTALDLNEDGSFSGQYIDQDLGVRECYISTFEGSFGTIEKVNDHTYTFTDIEYKTLEDKDEWDEDGLHFFAVEPYGLENVESMTLYLPGTPASELSESLCGWEGIDPSDTKASLENYVLWDEDEQVRFAIYEDYDAPEEETATQTNAQKEKYIVDYLGYTLGAFTDIWGKDYSSEYEEGGEGVYYEDNRIPGMFFPEASAENDYYMVDSDPIMDIVVSNVEGDDAPIAPKLTSQMTLKELKESGYKINYVDSLPNDMNEIDANMGVICTCELQLDNGYIAQYNWWYDYDADHYPDVETENSNMVVLTNHTDYNS